MIFPNNTVMSHVCLQWLHTILISDSNNTMMLMSYLNAFSYTMSDENSIMISFILFQWFRTVSCLTSMTPYCHILTPMIPWCQCFTSMTSVIPCVTTSPSCCTKSDFPTVSSLTSMNPYYPMLFLNNTVLSHIRLQWINTVQYLTSMTP